MGGKQSVTKESTIGSLNSHAKYKFIYIPKRDYCGSFCGVFIVFWTIMAKMGKKNRTKMGKPRMTRYQMRKLLKDNNIREFKIKVTRLTATGEYLLVIRSLCNLFYIDISLLKN